MNIFKAPVPTRCELDFCCSQTGELFLVRFKRARAQGKFRVVAVSESPLTSQKRGEFESQETGLAYWLRSLLGYGRCTDSDSRVVNCSAEFDGSEFDFSGWYCPYCRHPEQPEAPFPFVQCSECGEYVCGGSIVPDRNGRFLFVCHDACGGSGPVSGCIHTFSGSSVEKVDRSSSRAVPGESPQAESEHRPRLHGPKPAEKSSGQKESRRHSATSKESRSGRRAQ
jgi:hypothetical protein